MNINHRYKQRGDAMAVGLVVVVVALVAALGFIFWQNVIKKDDTKTDTEATQSTDADQTSNWKTYDGTYFSVSYPGDADIDARGVNDAKDYQAIDRITPTEVNEDSPSSDFTISVAAYSKNYPEASGGTPATVTSVPVATWYKNLKTVKDSGTDLNYEYKVTRSRGGMNSAVLYMLNGEMLYEITLEEGGQVELADSDDVNYVFSPEIKKILASFEQK